MNSDRPARIGEILNPRSVAVIGASEDQTKFGGRIFRMLIKHGFGGEIYPINPNRAELFGRTAYPSIAATPRPAELAIMAIPAAMVKGTIAACAKAGVNAAIVITAKFSDAGPEGSALEAEIVRIARAAGMRLIGPNCLGLISPANSVVLCSSPALEVDKLIMSPIALVSQSGALMATIFDRAFEHGVGFSHCISVGNQADLELNDFAEYLIEDDQTAAICSYVEGIKDPPRFLRLAERARARGKPWLMVKAGRTAQGARAAFSHTASLAGSYEALAAVCRDHGVILMDDVDAMMLLAASLVRFPARPVRSVAVITTSGGGGAIAADRLTDLDIPLTAFTAATAEALGAHYGPGQAANPIDLGGRRDGDAIDVAAETVRIVVRDPAEDVALFVMTTAPLLARTTAVLADAALEGTKPALFVMQPGQAAAGTRAELVKRRVPFCNSLDEALRALRTWIDWRARPHKVMSARPTGLPASAPLEGWALGQQLDEATAKHLLAACGVPVNRGELAVDLAATCAAAHRIGYPVALKAVSPDIVHKSDAGAVALGIASEAELRTALAHMVERVATAAPGARIEGFIVEEMIEAEAELILGIKHDAQFGPLVIVGAGGVLVELLADVAVATAPVGRDEALQMLRSLRIWPILAGARGRSVLDVEAVADAIERLSWLAHGWGARLAELDINPLMVRRAGEGCVAVDARALLARSAPDRA
jgi:acetyl-CoA synthetase (ADP-forming)